MIVEWVFVGGGLLLAAGTWYNKELMAIFGFITIFSVVVCVGFEILVTIISWVAERFARGHVLVENSAKERLFPCCPDRNATNMFSEAILVGSLLLVAGIWYGDGFITILGATTIFSIVVGAALAVLMDIISWAVRKYTVYISRDFAERVCEKLDLSTQ
jgi:hypothetical protein